jgi:putative phage-type endonuclease
MGDVGHSALVLCGNPTETEFRDVRRALLTATDIGVVLGLSPWKTRYSLALEKKGLVAPAETSDAMWLGTQSEPIIIESFRRKMGRRVEPNRSILCHPVQTWAGCTPDGWTFDPFEGLEAKLAGLHSARDWGEPGTAEVPPLYFSQVQWSMYVTGLTRWHLVAQIGTKIQIHPIDRDDAIIEGMVNAGREFRERYLLTNELPDPGADDVDAVTRMYPTSTDRVLDATEELRALAVEFAAGREQKGLGEAREKAARARIEAAMKEADKLVGSDFKISWRNNKPTTKVDLERAFDKALAKLPNKYAEELQKIVAECTRTVPGARVFRPTGPLFKGEE